MENIVYFRTLEEEDYILIHKWYNDDDLKKLSVGLNRRLSLEEARQWVLKRRGPLQYEVWWAICSVKDNRLVGYASLNSIHYINRTAEFGGIVIGDPEFRDGLAWIQTYMFVFEYAFQRLNLNRLSGAYIEAHPQTSVISKAFFFQREGLRREAIFKNGKYYDLAESGILASEYYEHLQNGDYEIRNIIKRIAKISKELKT